MDRNEKVGEFLDRVLNVIFQMGFDNLDDLGQGRFWPPCQVAQGGKKLI
jgi:hypothetical protein